MNLWHDVEAGDDVPNVINVIVEIPKGSQNKYEYDKKLNIIRLDRVLFSPFHYPGDYGLLPRTLSADGDPLDALVLVTNPTHPGVLIKSRPIGMLTMRDVGKTDNKILCVPKYDPRFDEYGDVTDLEEHLLKEIAHFFGVYKELEQKKVKMISWKNAAEAKKVIMKSIRRYDEKYGSKEPSTG